MKKIFVLAAVFVAVTGIAQNVPAPVKQAFETNFPNTTVKKWDKEDGDYEANFNTNGKTMSATFDAAGNLKETETGIKISELPAPVADYVKTNYKDAAIKEASVVERGKEKMYEAEVKGKDLLFDMQGKFLKEEKD
jgi:hypothetical protein